MHKFKKIQKNFKKLKNSMNYKNSQEWKEFKRIRKNLEACAPECIVVVNLSQIDFIFFTMKTLHGFYYFPKLQTYTDEIHSLF